MKRKRKLFRLIVDSVWFSCDTLLTKTQLNRTVKTIAKSHKIFIKHLKNVSSYKADSLMAKLNEDDHLKISISKHEN